MERGLELASVFTVLLSPSHRTSITQPSRPGPHSCPLAYEAPDQTSGSPYSGSNFLPLGIKGQTETVKMMKLEDEGWGHKQPRGRRYLVESMENMKSECAKI